MFKQFKRISFAAACTVAAVMVSFMVSLNRGIVPAKADAITLGGTYSVTRLAPDNKLYDGTLTITPAQDTYDLAWTFSDGTKQTGFGLRTGETLSAVWGGDTGSNKCVLEAYTVGATGLTDGTWLASDKKSSGKETVKANGALADDQVSGNYGIEAANADGTTNKAELVVAPSGKAFQFTKFQFTKTVGSSKSVGQGVKRGNVLTVGFGDPNCVAATYQILPDGSLNGYWSAVNDKSLGVEQASTSIDGKYTIAGPHPGQLKVSTQGPVNQFQWQVGISIEGLGVRQSDVVATVWGYKKCDVKAYQIVDNKTLISFTGELGSKSVGTETLTRDQASDDLLGTYQIAGVDADGKPYSASVEVKIRNDIYLFNETMGDDTITGVGAKLGDVLAVATGDQCHLVAYQVDASKKLTGVFGDIMTSKLNHEIGTPHE